MNKKQRKITVSKARKLVGVTTDYQLAKFLGVSRQLVHSWKKRGFIGYAHAERIAGYRPARHARGGEHG